MNKKVIAALLIIATAGITVLQGSYQAKRAQQRRTPTAKRQTALARQKTALKKVTRPATPYKAAAPRTAGRAVARKPLTAEPLPESISTGTEISTQEMGTQTEGPSLELLITLQSTREESGVRLLQYARIIEKLKNDPLATLLAFAIARDGYLALDKIMTDIATDQAIQQTDMKTVLEDLIQRSNNSTANFYQKMLTNIEPDETKRIVLKNQIDKELPGYINDHEKALTALITKQMNFADTALTTLQNQSDPKIKKPLEEITNYLETLSTTE